MGAIAWRYARRADRAPVITAQAAPGSKARFLRCYALYLAGEKRKTEELVEVAGPMVCAAAGRSVARLIYSVPCSQGRSNDVVNQELPQLEAELAPLFDQACTGAALFVREPV